jgi:hypothetical protein
MRLTHATVAARAGYSRLLRRIALTLSARTQPGHNTVATIRCIPVEKTLCSSEGGFVCENLLNFLLVSVCPWYKINTLQMHSCRTKGKTVHSEAKEMVNLVNRVMFLMRSVCSPPTVRPRCQSQCYSPE